jgi:Family of unknown function (DUF5678)
MATAASQARQCKPPPENGLAAEARVFERQRAQLARRYAGQFVALYGGRVVGHDKHAEALAARLFAELGDVPFFIARAERRPAVCDLPSPDLER